MRSTPRARSRRGATEVASLRSFAILKAIEQVLEGAGTRRLWREFELVWFTRRLHEARASLRAAPPKGRIAFVDGLRGSYVSLCNASGDPGPLGEASRAMSDALRGFFDELEGRVAHALETSDEIYAAADRIRRAGGVPFFNRITKTVDRLPKAKAIADSVWVVHQNPGTRSYSLSHGPSATKVNLPSLTRPKLEAIARHMADDAPDLARDAPLMHEVPGGPLGTQLVGGITSREVMRELLDITDRAMARANISWGVPISTEKNP